MDILPLASSSAGNSYRILDGVTALLIEAGIPFREIQKKLNYRLSEVKGVLVSHSHLDHSKSVKDVVKAGIDVYCSMPTAETLNVQDSHRVWIIEPRVQFKIGSLAVLPFEVQHDCPGALGFLIQSMITGEKLVFITDSYYSHYRFSGLDYIMVECNFADDILQANIDAGRVPEEMRRRLIHSHFSLDNVKDFLKANDLSKVQAIYLLHLSDTNSNAERFKREIAALTGKITIVC